MFWSAVLVSLFVSSACFADWKISKIETKAMPADSPPSNTTDVMVEFEIVNMASKDQFVFGQIYSPTSHYYKIECFVKRETSQVWDKMVSWMCGSLGAEGMVPVAAGDTIHTRLRFFESDIGKNAVLTFRSADSKANSVGYEVLLGPFEVPAVKSGNGE